MSKLAAMSRRVIVLLCLAVVGMSGCGLPTWSEIIGSKPEDTGPVNVVPMEPPLERPAVVAEQPAPPEPPSPEEVIARFKELRPHQIDDTALTELVNLGEGLEAIDELDLRGSQLSKAGFKNLQRLPALAKLDIRGTSLRGADYESIGAVGSLEELQVDGSSLSVEGARSLQSLSNLRVLRAEQLRLPPLVWQDFLASFPNLEQLFVIDSNLSDPLMNDVAKLKNLNYLAISRAPVTDVGLAAIGTLENLETLVITQCQIHGEGFRRGTGSGANKAFRNLVVLSVLDTPLNERGARAISQMKELKVLWIGGMPTMLDSHFSAIVKPLSNLEVLNLPRNPGLTGQALSAVSGHQHLREIRFDHCRRIDDTGLKHLHKCKKLELVDLSNTSCTLQGVLALREAVPDVQIVGLDR